MAADRSRNFLLLPEDRGDNESALEDTIQQQQPDHPHPSAPFSSLTPIAIADLRPGTRATGRFLLAHLIFDPVRMITDITHFFTRIASGGEPLLLAIKHDRRASDGDRFPRGARVAIKEPTLRLASGGLTFIAFENPSNLQVLSFFPDSELARLRSKTSRELREYGNQLRGAGAAAEVYQLSSDMAQVRHLPHDQLLALSNRAECLLRMNRFEECVDAADAALSLDPAHAKSAYKKAMALLGLRLYRWSSEVLSGLLGSEDGTVDAAYEKARRLAMQSLDVDGAGCVEKMSTFVHAWAENPAPRPAGSLKFPELADYVGPVEVRRCEYQSYNHGMGLFATRDIKKGEPVMVSKPLVCMERSAEFNRNAVAQLLYVTSKSRRAYEQVYHGLVRSRDGEIPDMKLFRPNWISPEDWSGSRSSGDGENLAVSTAYEVVEKLAFRWMVVQGDHDLRDDEPRRDIGFWLLARFINHSCTPNVSRTVFGESLCFRATRDIAADEEIVWSYVFPSHPYRRKRLEDWNMRCGCRKCELESDLEEELKEVTACYVMPESPEFSVVIKPDTDLTGVLIKLETVLNLKLDTEDDRQRLRCVHWGLYVLYHQCLASGQLKVVRLPRGVLPPMEVIMAANQKFSAGFNFGCFSEAMARYAGDKEVADRIIRDEWECKLGQLEDDVFKEVSERYVELSQLLCERAFTSASIKL